MVPNKEVDKSYLCIPNPRNIKTLFSAPSHLEYLLRFFQNLCAQWIISGMLLQVNGTGTVNRFTYCLPVPMVPLYYFMEQVLEKFFRVIHKMAEFLTIP
jgi:hypothetical protein